ncbi:uncharacterized protein AMSG_07953 [Thecamonas trahens ATCC 50062]|uniref:F-box domain-containing protein n=1 Tax=Thecamonas trahens ATCC 50062 TaxID=461836 RepID=A0A0L0DI01_THETB|nr:hypothetical protein AMSG_07953 [Thecamonas trahens ATCC 50062]KNC51860.1 hypothetical protein AMSG_07953 [Thecamonas trahens ATCC 50062]|eukprot:XP_013755721.1 hypothetical protein AMSG_07953 [Thecamonas trahens ATCC 50062]
MASGPPSLPSPSTSSSSTSAGWFTPSASASDTCDDLWSADASAAYAPPVASATSGSASPTSASIDSTSDEFFSCCSPPLSPVSPSFPHHPAPPPLMGDLAPLPAELVLHILRFLPLRQRAVMREVSRGCAELASIPLLWRTVRFSRHLALSRFDGAADLWLAAVTRAPYLTSALRSLSLATCKDVTDTGLALALPQLPRLESLDLSRCWGVTDALLASLALAPAAAHLRSLNLYMVYQVTDVGITRLAPATPRLVRLNLYKCSLVTDTGLAVVAASCPDLVELTLYGLPHISDAGVAGALPLLPDLRKLNLGSCKQLTDAALINAASLPALATLHLLRCSAMSDALLRCLAASGTAASLVSLNCHGLAKLTDSGVVVLAAVASDLERLNLSRCTGISADGAIAIVAKCRTLARLTLDARAISPELSVLAASRAVELVVA